MELFDRIKIVWAAHGVDEYLCFLDVRFSDGVLYGPTCHHDPIDPARPVLSEVKHLCEHFDLEDLPDMSSDNMLMSALICLAETQLALEPFDRTPESVGDKYERLFNHELDLDLMDYDTNTNPWRQDLRDGVIALRADLDLWARDHREEVFAYLSELGGQHRGISALVRTCALTQTFLVKVSDEMGLRHNGHELMSALITSDVMTLSALELGVMDHFERISSLEVITDSPEVVENATRLILDNIELSISQALEIARNL